MYEKDFYYKKALENDFTRKCIRNEFYNKNYHKIISNEFSG